MKNLNHLIMDIKTVTVSHNQIVEDTTDESEKFETITDSNFTNSKLSWIGFYYADSLSPMNLSTCPQADATI